MSELESAAIALRRSAVELAIAKARHAAAVVEIDAAIAHRLTCNRALDEARSALAEAAMKAPEAFYDERYPNWGRSANKQWFWKDSHGGSVLQRDGFDPNTDPKLAARGPWNLI
jgi:hypothetical protein